MKNGHKQSRRDFISKVTIASAAGAALTTGIIACNNEEDKLSMKPVAINSGKSKAELKKYEKSNFSTGNGYHVGVVCLNQNMPFIPGDVQCASTFDFPIIYKVALEGTSAKILDADPGMGNWLKETAIGLEKRGVKALTGDSGYMLPYQKNIAKAINIPIALSSLVQIPFVGSMFDQNKTVAIVCAASPPLDVKTLENFGVGINNNLVVYGMQDDPAVVEIMFRAVNIASHGTVGDADAAPAPFDADRLAESFYQMGVFLKKKYPNLGGVILECSDFPPYAAAMQAGIDGLPVFDFIGIINLLESGTRDY